MLAIKNNLMAENAARHLGKSYDALAKSVERLSSGLRINSAKDDAAGLAVRELVRADVAMPQQGSRNAADAISMLQTAEGAMGVINEILIRMKELAEQAATGSYSATQRSIMNAEYVELTLELDRIAKTTTFNAVKLLNSSATVKIHMGTSDTIDITAQKMLSSVLGVKVSMGVQESQINLRGVAEAGDKYIEAAEITVGAASASWVGFRFSAADGSAWARLDLSAYSASGITLNQLVNDINTEWRASVASGEYVAFAYYDSDSQQYNLKLENPDAEVATFVLNSTSAIGIFDNADDFTKAATGAAGTAMDLTTTGGAQSALDKLTSAIETKDSYRAELGYLMNRLEAAVSILNIQAENLMAAESRISDVDVATEMAAMTRNQVLSQAGIAMLAQANTMPQMALQLLR
jgi:flagellin